MLALLRILLPSDKKALLDLAVRMMEALDTPEERTAAAQHGIKILADGKVTVSEWATFGKALGVFKNGVKK